MSRAFFPLLFSLATATASLGIVGDASGRGATDAGLITRASPLPFAQTVEKIEQTARARGLVLFARIDHAEEAAKAGLTMRPTVLIVLGNPKGGTPVMVAAPTAAIDLPLKVLVAEDASGATFVTVNDPAYLQQRHHVPTALVPNIAGLGSLLDVALQ